MDSLRQKLMDELEMQRFEKTCKNFALQYYKNCANETSINFSEYTRGFQAIK
jgi:hypothetical protein